MNPITFDFVELFSWTLDPIKDKLCARGYFFALICLEQRTKRFLKKILTKTRKT